jgi:hypothetical protein
LHQASDLRVATDHRIQLASTSGSGEIAAELIEGAGFLLQAEV